MKLYEFVRAYGAFANGGFVVEPYAIQKIKDSRGRVLYSAGRTKMSHKISLKTAAEMTAMMKTVILSGTGTAANIGRPAAGKTGTTDDYRDAYFVGYTPDIVTGVWVGDDNNKQMRGLTGGTVPARIWKDVMLAASKDLEPRDFDYPEIKLDNYYLGFGKAKVIADDENPTNDGKSVVPTGTQTEGNNNTPTENSTKEPQTPTPSTPITQKIKTLQQVQKEMTNEVKENKPVTTPKTTQAPLPSASSTSKAPIPMAVPDSLR